MDFNDGAHSSEERRISGHGVWIHAPGFAGWAMAVGSILAQLLFGIFALLEADGELLKVGATFFVIFGASEAAWILRSLSKARTWSLKDWTTDFEEPKGSIDALEKILNSDSSREEVKAQALRALHDLRTRERGRVRLFKLTIDAIQAGKFVEGASIITTGRDPLYRQASVFYVGLLAGLLGTAVAVYGLVSEHYPSTLTGSILASIGFVALGLALLSAEDKSDSLNG